MEIEDEKSGSKLVIDKFQKVVFGRGNGLDKTDPTVSRRHVLFEFDHTNATRTEPVVSFEVIGRNPIWVQSQRDADVRVFRRSEKGELAAGYRLCVSGKRPIWYSVRNLGEDKKDERVLESESELLNGSELGDVDVSSIDPVKEFGFIVMGHEFDQYPKQMVRDVKYWSWFLEEPGKECDDSEEDEMNKRRAGRRKRKKGVGNEDEEWTGDSDVDEELVAKHRMLNKPKYSTRSKVHNKSQKQAKASKSSDRKKTVAADEKDIEDEDDETLGGFIVGEDDLEEEEEDPDGTHEYEEEDEFVEDDDDEVDD